MKLCHPKLKSGTYFPVPVLYMNLEPKIGSGSDLLPAYPLKPCLICTESSEETFSSLNGAKNAIMFGRRLVESVVKNPQTNQFASFCTSTEKGKSKTLSRKVVPILLISLTGGVALSAINDLAIYHGCSSKAMEKASQSQAILDALGEPIERGPWYNASLAVAHRRSSVSCTFPVSGPRGTGIFQLKAVREGDDSWLPYLLPFLRQQNWEILIMEALVHTPSNEEKNQTLRISLSDAATPSASNECTGCTRSQDSSSPESAKLTPRADDTDLNSNIKVFPAPVKILDYLR
ncbi:Cytochrome oxidase assembly protein 1 [Macleaya cordata]|uniref:Cytochrome oxidase assembly protein 1 n=1 Tax=Macleaya cordata TaxID=56857 RepID=A0A200PVU3_MACCD|nr:Cytochrome oxidase assembly protein 1 [Macleaya cordata]